MKIVVVGAGGRLGAALLRSYRNESEIVGFNHAQLDLAAPDEIKEKLRPLQFDILINCAAQTNVDRCEKEPEEAFALNAEAPRLLAEICDSKRAKLIHISTDYVFDGEKSEPYTEEDEAKPISVYGESKREGEQRILDVNSNHLVVRVSWVFGPDRPSFIDWLIAQAREHDHVEAIADKISAPTYTIDIAQLLQPLFMSSALGGIFHIANAGECSWREYGQWALECCQAKGITLRTHLVHPISLADMKNFIARRPRYTVLSSNKFTQHTGIAPRHWRDAVAEYVRAHISA